MPDINQHTMAYKPPLTAKQKKQLLIKEKKARAVARALRLSAMDAKHRKMEEQSKFDIERLKLDASNQIEALRETLKIKRLPAPNKKKKRKK